MRRSDEQLHESWCAGEKRAGEELFNRHFSSIYRFFLTKLEPEAADLTQQTFLACVGNRRTFTGRSSFRAWLFGIARNLLHDRLRARFHRPSLELFEESMSSLTPVPPEHVSLANWRPEVRLLLNALRQLPIDRQILIELHYWEELSVAEIAEILCRPYGTVTSQLKRTRELLDRLISDLGESPELVENTVRELARWMSEVREHATTLDHME